MNNAPKSFYIAVIITALISASALAFGSGLSSRLSTSLYSPGEVIKDHDKATCMTCHSPFKGAIANGCLGGDCHIMADLEGRGATKVSPAVASMHSAPDGEKCLDCHTEHKGENGIITLAYHESGTTNCNKCHLAEGKEAHPFMDDSNCKACHDFKDWERVSFSHRDVSEKPCASCHLGPTKDFHVSLPKEQGARDSDCAACHDVERWKPAEFKHDLIAVGAGIGGNPATRPACRECHGTEATEAHPDIRYEGCSACHSSTESWKDIGIDHEAVPNVSCVSCHAIPEGDLHASVSDDCQACHNVNKWKPAEFDHQLVKQGLEKDCNRCHAQDSRKAHPDIKSTTCDSCHKSTKSWEEISFTHNEVRGQACTDCHSVPRGSLHANVSNDCKACHGTKAWKPAKFDHQYLNAGKERNCSQCHAAEGKKAHSGIQSTSCASCHKSTQKWDSVSFSHSEATGQSCSSCHSAPRDWFHRSTNGMSCSSCHSTKAWEPSTFRHPRIPEFGEHMEHLTCTDCHPSSLKQAQPCSACHGFGRGKEGGGHGDDEKDDDD